MRHLRIAAGLLGLSSLSCGHGVHFDDDQEFLEAARLARRQAQPGAACGPPGNTVCGSGLCCSANNICGTGVAYCGAPGCQLSFGPQCDGNQPPTGKDTSNIPRPLFGSVPYGVSISHCSLNGMVALTFDDGPYIYTSDLLDLLQKNNVTATFFVVGANGGKGQIENASTGYPEIIQRMVADGHQVGSHTWSHQDLATLTATQRHDQIVWNEMALVDILGFFPTYLRPPYTDWNQAALNDLLALGYHVLNYDIDTRDWQGNYTYAETTFSTILQQHSPASSSWISLAHDIENQTVHGFAQYMIDQARQLNYKLVTVGECLGDPAINWYRDPTTGQPFNVTKVMPSLTAAAALAAVSVTTAGSSSPGPSLSPTPGPSSGSSGSHSPSSGAATPSTVSGADFEAGSGNSTLTPTGSGTAASGAAVPSATKSAAFASSEPPSWLIGSALVLTLFYFL